MAGKAAPNVDAYLAAAPPKHRAALERLRRAIRSAAPGAEEVISYQMPALKYEGRVLVYYAAFKDHCSFFPASSAINEAHRNELEAAGAVVNNKGTIRFAPEKPLPAALVRTIVKERIAENRERKRR
jgi:uncharacterized protein YdhG (YjbR/CyaY superfamily)